MELRALIDDLTDMLEGPPDPRLQELMTRSLLEGDVDLVALDEIVEGLDLDEAFLKNVRRAVAKAKRAVTKVASRIAKRVTKKVQQVRKALAWGGAKRPKAKTGRKRGGAPACPPGQRMVFGVCRVIGKTSSDLDVDDEDGSKSSAWHAKQAKAHRDQIKQHGAELSKSWNDPDISVPRGHIQKSAHHRDRAREHEKMAALSPEERKRYAAQKKADAAKPKPPADDFPGLDGETNDKATRVTNKKKRETQATKAPPARIKKRTQTGPELKYGDDEAPKKRETQATVTGTRKKLKTRQTQATVAPKRRVA